MQAFGFNGVVAEPKERLPQANFSVPRPLHKALEEGLWDRIEPKRKWEAYAAAILAFYRLTDEEQYAAMDEVVAARRRKDFRHLLARKGEASPTKGRLNPPKARRTGDAVNLLE